MKLKNRKNPSFFIASAVAFLLLFYNIKTENIFLKNYDFVGQEEVKISFFDDSAEVFEIPQKSEKKTETKIEKEPEKKAVAVSAKDVKGKVIERYISPYTAKNSYDKVYLKNNTNLSINIKDLLESKLKFSLKKTSSPQVLIVHTHATETFLESDATVYSKSYKSRTTNNEKNMVKIGSIIAKELNDAGIVTLHAKTQHDYPEYTGSYSRAANTICSYLNKYPSIKIVLDLHRDALSSGSDKIKLVTKINGEKAAQVMLVMGSQSGGVKNFPKWKENMKLAVRLQKIMETKYPTLARPITLNSSNYNESLTTGSLLIEFGTDVNSLAEAKYSAKMVGDCLKTLFKDLGA